ncbi:HalOD1 output domain-containing protein [Halovivax gelatinilyticus]|uniref:HalOD1 output domain-containing protein n=1 Tax=Halovivax gelatinilyticus TaxID=2961597 RepID=UPI0020CA306C|nr:HalOD1 output domain-containing protein [Halovivax gelatinilyticus]
MSSYHTGENGRRRSIEDTVYRDETTGTYHVWVDANGSADPAVTSIITAVSVATGRDPLELETLSKTIDPDALERLLDHWHRPNGKRSRAIITFEYEGCRITITGDGSVEVDPIRSPLE